MRNPFLNPRSDRESYLPDETEEHDIREIQKAIDLYFDKAYPDFEPEVIVAREKEYWLPALKVLKYYKGKFSSPSVDATWRDMELHAICVKRDMPSITSVPMNEHSAPDEHCDCGIYGSVNIEEIEEYLFRGVNPMASGGVWGMSPTFVLLDGMYVDDIHAYTMATRDQPRNVLCIIEPYPDAKVIRTRKGWKASHAFISEIIPDTMNLSDASRLLSIAWHRNIDIRRLYESR